MLNPIRLRAVLERAADTLEQLAPVLNSTFDAEAQVTALRAAVQDLANNATPLVPGADGCDGRVLPARWRAVPAKPTKTMVIEARQQLSEMGLTAVTFQQAADLYQTFLALAPQMIEAQPADTAAPAVRLAPYAGG